MIMISVPASQPDHPPKDALRGAPRWATSELVAETIETWQPYYNGQLTDQEALAILLSVGELVTTLEAE